MSRSAGVLHVVLILLALVLAVVAPIMASGYADLSRAEELKRAGEVPPAAQYYESAARKLPWKPELWDLAASSYAIAGHWENAMPLFALGKRLGVLSAQSWVLYGLGYELDGRSQEAADTWADGLRHYPKEAIFYYWIARDDQRRNDFAAEAQALSVWVASGEARAFSHYRLGQLLMTSDPDRARAELKRAASMETAYASALETLQASLDLAARETSASRRLVILGRGLGLVYEWPLAQNAFEQAVIADQQNPEAWAWLGEALQENGKDGKPQLDKALSLDANDTLVHALRGLYWKRQGEYTAQIAEYARAAQLEPGNAEWQAALGEAYGLKGDLVSALASYQKATSLAPDNAAYWRLLAMFCADNGVQVLDVGLPAAKKAAELAPNDPQVLDALGWSYAQAGLLYSAEQTLIKAASLTPGSALAHFHLAETYLRKGDQTSALRELKLAHQLDPNGATGILAGQLIQQYFP